MQLTQADLIVAPFRDGEDFDTQAAITKLYRGWFDFGPIMHQTLVGNGIFYLYLVRYHGEVVGAGVIKSPETVMPTGQGVQPIAWVISDVVTKTTVRRRGVARRLLGTLEAEVVKKGGRIIYLHTEQTNEAAIRLYLKAGYQRLRPQGHNVVFAKLIGE